MRKLEHLGVERSVVGLVIPAGFSFNLDGSAVYLTMASLFLAQAVGIDLSWQQQLVMVGVMMLTSKGTAGIAGGAFIVLASTITAVGHVPLAALALIVGIDRMLNEGRVFINVLGNALGAIVIGKWENAFDASRAQDVLAGKIPFDVDDEDDDHRIKAGAAGHTAIDGPTGTVEDTTVARQPPHRHRVILTSDTASLELEDGVAASHGRRLRGAQPGSNSWICTDWIPRLVHRLEE